MSSSRPSNQTYEEKRILYRDCFTARITLGCLHHMLAIVELVSLYQVSPPTAVIVLKGAQTVTLGHIPCCGLEAQLCYQ